MTDLTDVLHRATDDLEPEDPDLLLERAVRRGAALRRRRQGLTASAAVSGLAAATVLAVVVLGRPAAERPTFSDPGPSAPTSTAAPDVPAVTVDRQAFGTTFAAVLPGTISHEHDVPADRVHEAGGYESSFRWNGYPVAVAMWPYDGSARAGCAAAVGDRGSNQLCVRVRDGWAVHDPQMTQTVLNRWVSVFRDNGFRVWVMITNGPGKGSVSGGPPPLDVADLERVATSDLWFR